MTERRVRISPEMCIGGRDLTEPRLDPGGRWLAFVSRQGRTAALVIVDLSGTGRCERLLATVPAPSPGRGRGGGCFSWAPDGSAIVYAAGDGALWWQPVPGGAPRRLVEPAEGRPAQAPAVSPDGQAVAYVVDQAEVWLVATDGQSPRRIDAGDHEFCLDPAWSPDGRTVVYQAWSPPDMPWDGAVAVEVEPASGGHRVVRVRDGAVQQPRFGPDGSRWTVHDATGWLNVHRDDHAVVAGGETAEHAEPTWGPGQSSYAVSPDGRHVALTRNEDGFGRLVVVDVATGVARDVARGVHGALSWVGGRLAALRSGARTPTEVVVYDTATWQRTTIATGPVAGWDEAALAEPALVTTPAADGVTLHGRLYRPEDPSGRLLCWIHGGPTSQWPVEFLPRVAYWVDQGWDVLVPDARGSTGHGRAYQQALHGGWGIVDVADTVALVDQVHSAGVGTPARTVCIGGSSGGMTVVVLLTTDAADRFAGGVAAYPVTDLVALADRSHRYEAHYTDTLVAPRSEEATLRARSPLRAAGDLRRPLLLLHGTADPVVPFEGTVEFADTARRAGADVELHLFDDEGHGFSDPAHQLAEYELFGHFLARVTNR